MVWAHSNMPELSSARAAVLRDVAAVLCSRPSGRPLRVGVDGVCGSGKTTFTDELADVVATLGRPVVRLDPDGFHHVRTVRYQQGRDSARGYYEDAFDFDALRELTLAPLAAGGSPRYAARVHDLDTDDIVREWATAPDDAVVLFDATFLQRGALRGYWDDVVYLDVSATRARERGAARDAAKLGGLDSALAAYDSRYLAACKIYLAEENPRDRASIVVDNNDPARPLLIRS